MPPAVNASLSRPLAKGLRLSFDVKNVFDRHLPSDSYLFQPTQPRGVMLELRKSW
jgi:outer membrane receptor protein involved in Fe transport